MSGQKLWETILQGSSQTKRYQEATLILVGHKGCGSRHLISSLQKGPGSLGKQSMYTALISPDDPIPNSCPLQYSYINSKDISDPHSYKISKVNIYTLELPELKSLLEFALNSKNLDNTLFGIVLDWEQPWRFKQDLETWTEVWHEMLGKVLSSLPIEEQDRLIARVSSYVKGYNEPGVEKSGENILGEGVLEVNLGVPVMIVCCKSDLVFTVDKNRDLNDKVLESVLKALRKFAVTYSASIFYTSTKSGNNINVLYDYIMHRIYGFPFKHKAQVLTKDSIFIPSGWDSSSLIKETNYVEAEGKVQELLSKPKTKVANKSEVKIVNDQEFLVQMKEKLANYQKPAIKDMLTSVKIGGDVVMTVVENAQESAPKDSQVKLQDFYRMLLEKGTKESK